MSGRIRQLPDGVVNQIAAGEVVERPASVLKELLENAMDARASRVEVRVSGPFPYTITVSDDGCGMTADEVELAVRRHTTSKIVAAEDLRRIETYGFRGEALPSIAAVSRLRIVTRPRGDRLATGIVVEGGRVLSSGEEGAPEGTTVEVSELFANVPARRKFLRSPRTELFRLREVFHHIAIPGQGVFLRMTDDRGEVSYDAGEKAADRALRHAEEDGKYLVAVRHASPFYRLLGWAGYPQTSRLGGSGLHFYVNGRNFRDKGVTAAVREAYRGILPSDRLPLVYLFIECDPSEVDVNVHPAKSEVRFRYPRELFDLIRHAIGEALGETGPRPAIVSFSPDHGGGRDPALPFRGSEGDLASLFGETAPGRPLPPPSRDGFPLPGGRFSALKPVGQILGTYLVCEGMGEVVIIDQHAAGERIVFSRLKEAYLGKTGPVQHWLVPQVVTFDGETEAERDAVQEFLSRVGFVGEPCGESAFRIKGGPAVLGRLDIQRWWRDFREFLAEQGSPPKGIFDADRELWRMACHAAVRGGDPLEPEGIRQFLREIDRAVASHSCPHGRPVWVKLSRAEMGRMFGRT